jgi:hypothetical protein
MDFVERIFHIAPDGGSGLMELAILLTIACVVTGALWLAAKFASEHSGLARAGIADEGSGQRQD